MHDTTLHVQRTKVEGFGKALGTWQSVVMWDLHRRPDNTYYIVSTFLYSPKFGGGSKGWGQVEKNDIRIAFESSIPNRVKHRTGNIYVFVTVPRI